jgi:hypothetical protein
MCNSIAGKSTDDNYEKYPTVAPVGIENFSTAERALTRLKEGSSGAVYSASVNTK